MRTTMKIGTLVVALLAFSSPSSLAQTTWYVDVVNCNGSTGGSGTQADPFCLIQSAINVALDGDLVLVAQGTYVENIDFLGKAITVRSDVDFDAATDDIDTANTIIDGNQAGSVIIFENGEGRDSVIEGFTITNGLHPVGGGIR